MHDIRTRIKLYVGEKQALVVQNFQSFYKVAELALGGGEKKKELPPEVKTKSELKSKFAAIMRSV